MSSKFNLFRNSFLYFLIPAIGAASPFLVIPAVTTRLGSEGWVAMAIAQSLGTAAAVVGELGWGVVGPQRVPKLNLGFRQDLYRSSLASRLLTTIPLSLVAAVIAYFVTSNYRLEASAIALVTSLFALSPTWFFIGSNQPSKILLIESLPRLAFTSVAGVLIYFGNSLFVYPGLVGAQIVLTLLMANSHIGIRAAPKMDDFKAAPKLIRGQAIIGLGRSISVLYTALPVTFVGMVRPDAVSPFASSDRLMRMALSILSGLPSRLQSWLGGANENNIYFRRRTVIYANSALGFVSGAGFVIFFPLVSSWLFSGTVVVPFPLLLATGLLLMIICSSRGMGLILVSSGNANKITIAIAFAGSVGLLTIIPLSVVFGAVGAMISAIGAELTGIFVQVYFIRKKSR
jgi:O-antigen/teichoic acid export membrane protein